METLLEKGHKVRALDKIATGKIENLLLLLEKYLETLTLQVGDIRNPYDCRKANKGIEYVFHEAALGSVPCSIKDTITSK
jgi:UDP-N-acetylglucosamine 4-epimerase